MSGVMFMVKLFRIMIIFIFLTFSLCSCGHSTAPKNSDKKIEREKDTTKVTSKNDKTLPEIPPENTSKEVPEQPPTKERDMSGDYIGDIPCVLPPDDSTYTVYSEDAFECLVLYIENIDNANIKFRLTKAILNPSDGSVTEDLMFKEHIAHYNGDGYYEYIGKDYHLFFKYAIDDSLANYTPAVRTIDAFGFEGLFTPTEYSNSISDGASLGNRFSLNVPFAG